MRLEFRKDVVSFDGGHISRNRMSKAWSVLEASGMLRNAQAGGVP